ncbi:baseplate assembly protein [Tumebacillus flagellatus]|uniref:Uncharacterized protein n=1 Tax=Tumebacillus flagellatus TaxID=1157490 RepID=A0A074LUY1_9BACL|nr:baseplate J/gp47 family protein [Tumebacillus flagellatus]KEO84749.1 hypothetical protein EL26_01700 [Tumebacillus flagellatus]
MSGIQFVEADPDKTTTSIITMYESITGKKLFPADPERLFLLTISQIIVQQRALINATAKENLLRYATGDVLDGIGETVWTPRLEAAPATVTVRWWLSAPRAEVVLIEKGKRVSPGGGLYFAVAATTEVQTGDLYADVVCECMQAGTIGNGFVPGQINQIVDPIVWLSRVENITVSAGGTDRESDDRYRSRIRTAPERFSVAGPSGAYEYIVKAVDERIVDVLVYSPAAGVVEVRPLLEDGVPGDDVLSAVATALNDRSVRPLTDNVRVLAPEKSAYSIDLTYWINEEDATDATAIQAAVQKAVDDFQVWQRSKLGRDINQSELYRRVLNAGAKRAEIRSPVFAQQAQTQIAVASSVHVAFGGLEDA